MVTCIVIASVISLCSIFAFFGKAFSNTGGIAVPNMFQLMFGGTGSYSGYLVQWKQYGVLTFLFVLQILLMVAAIISFFICYNIKANYGEENHGVIVSIIMAMFSLIALIVSFCTLSITDTSATSRVRLGFGPIFYSSLNILIVILLVAGIAINYAQASRSYRSKPSAYRKVSVSTNTTVPAKPILTENEKADLILKYKKMLDDGAITQEEYDKKKKELL